MELFDVLEFHPVEACEVFKEHQSPGLTRSAMLTHPLYKKWEASTAEVRRRWEASLRRGTQVYR
jgi:hypothetical protein